MIWPWLLGTIAAIGFSGFYSGCETGLYCLNTVRLEVARRSGRRRAVTLGRTLADREGIIATILVGTNLSNYLATVCMVSMLMALQMSEQRAEFATVLVLTPVIFVFGEVVPKNLFRREADVLMYRLARALRISDLAFRATGVIALLRAMARLAARCVGFGRDGTLSTLEPRQQIAAMLREGVGTGILSDAQSDILDRVMNLSQVRVRSAMVPRNAVQTAPADIDRDGFVELARTHSCSRMPVMAGPDTVVGVINVFDVLLGPDPADRPPPPITDAMSPPLTLSPDQSVKTALTAMQRRGTAMAVVVDPQERFLGIVTLKDLIEEIVGDLEAW